MPVTRSPGQMDHDRRRVAGQLRRIARSRPAKMAYQADLFQRIRRRRTDAGLYDVRRIEGVDPFLAEVTTALLVRAQDRALAARILGPGFQHTEVLDRRLVRFSAPGLPAARAEAGLTQLQRRGVNANREYVVPLGYVTKEQGGFESSAYVSSPPGPPAPGAVQVALVDTGLDRALARTDGWLAHVPRDAGNIDPLYIAGSNNVLDYAAGHGQFAAGLIQQVCPDADIRMYRAVTSDGIGSETDIGQAILDAADDGARIINLSLGTQTVDDSEPLGLRTTFDILTERHPDVLVVAAAGNYGDARPTWPAAFSSVVSVAALTEQMAPAAWSSQGEWVTCSTVGEGLVSTYVAGTEAHEVDPHPETFTPDAWALGSGTSFAAPQIVGRVAFELIRNPGLTPRQALDQHVTANGTPVPNFGLAVRVLTGTSP